MTPEDHTAAIHALQNAISEIKAILNNGIRTMVNDQKTELATVKNDIQVIRDALTSHVAKEVAKEDVVYEIFKRVMNTGVSITGALIALLLAIIGYLLVNSVGLHSERVVLHSKPRLAAGYAADRRVPGRGHAL
jgi:phage-related protein